MRYTNQKTKNQKKGKTMKTRLETMKTSRVRKPRAKPQPLTNEQISALLSAADPEWRTMILVGLNTGQRLQDVARLTWDAIDLQHATICFRWTKARLQTVLIGPELVAHLTSLARPAEARAPVFATCFEDSIGQSSEAGCAVSAYAAGAGVETGKLLLFAAYVSFAGRKVFRSHPPARRHLLVKSANAIRLRTWPI